MKSKASFKSHPLHPILVSFPIAFFTGAFVFDLLGYFRDNASFLQTATYLIWGGLISGFAAAIPGLIDYIHVIPPQSSAKKRGARHALTNIAAMLLFATNLYLRTTTDTSLTTLLAIDAAAVALLMMAGYMGGTLVYRNQVGVDIRYADAGKWKETDTTISNGRIEAGMDNELTLNQMKLIKAGGKRIVLARTEEGYVAFADRCTHRGGSLAGGAMICGTVQCPWHGSQFSVKTGAVCAGPAKESIATYPTEVAQGKVFILMAQ